jgi:DNA-binding transcriptional ArsR family regulator
MSERTTSRPEPPALFSVFRALADPTRRRILDLLRERPRTTGDLAAAFPRSRFAVMKHLAVLERAHLVIPRREGRLRWNHLNAVPLERVYERWVKPYESHWSRALLGVERAAATAAGRGERTMSRTPKEELSVRAARVEMEVEIAAPPKRVWTALVGEMGTWWPRSFYAGKDTKAFVLEPRVGGRMYEDWGDGAGLLWFTVVSLDPPRALELSGHLFPAYGGPATSLVRIELSEGRGKTRLRLTDAIHGHLAADTDAKLDSGWKELFAKTFKEYVEGAA